MTDRPQLFKIVDGSNINIATDFPSQEMAQKYIDFQKSFWVSGTGPGPTPEPIPEPIPGELDEHGIKILAPRKAGGLYVTDFNYKRSTHNTGPRDTFSKVIGPPMNLGFIGYFKTELTDNSEEYSFKIHGGTHSGDGESNLTKQGRCIAIGLQQDGKPSFKIEYPYHNITPDFSGRVTFYDPNFKSTGSTKNKRIGIAGFAMVDKAANKAWYQLWVDLAPFVNGRPANQWKPMYRVENTPGKFVRDLYTENQGIKYGGQGIFYLRVDKVTYKTEVYGLKVYEIASLPVPNP